MNYEDLEIRMATPLKKLVGAWTEEFWGPRCEEVEPECPCCKAWKAFDVLFDIVEET